MALRSIALAAAMAAALFSPTLAEARGGGGGGYGGGGHSTGHAASSYCGACARDSHGRIARSQAAKHEFEAETGYPHGRPGYVVDHVIALKRGGPDTPANMQWQTKADAKAKDKVE